MKTSRAPVPAPRLSRVQLAGVAAGVVVAVAAAVVILVGSWRALTMTPGAPTARLMLLCQFGAAAVAFVAYRWYARPRSLRSR
jgi:hypothetical protein